MNLNSTSKKNKINITFDLTELFSFRTGLYLGEDPRPSVALTIRYKHKW